MSSCPSIHRDGRDSVAAAAPLRRGVYHWHAAIIVATAIVSAACGLYAGEMR